MKVLQENGLKAFMQSILNKFIKKEDTEQVTTVDVDTVPTNNSNHLITSGAVAGALATKLTEPSSNLAVGKYFRIASLDESGHAVLECVDPPTAPVQSVSAAGTALTPDANGNVNIPIAGIVGGGSYGVARFRKEYALTMTGTGYVCGMIKSEKEYKGGSPQFVISKGTLENIQYSFTKAAMTDGKGAAWTDAERLAALLRMGCTVDENGFVKWTATPSE